MYEDKGEGQADATGGGGATGGNSHRSYPSEIQISLYEAGLAISLDHSDTNVS